jgi:hypothetical protein
MVGNPKHIKNPYQLQRFDTRFNSCNDEAEALPHNCRRQ